jgi:predicted dehydrogenase
MSVIGVGVIGASPLNPGWAVAARLPAIEALPVYELRAVSTSNARSAEAAAAAFGVAAFENHQDLLAHAGVGLVVVTVRVPYHHAIISAAIAAGKRVLSEWPLANGLDEARDLAERARAAGIHTAVGLQARFSPAVRHARELVAEGYVGEVLGTTLVGSGIAWGGETDRAHGYMFDVSNGATTLSVSALHALDALLFVLGELATVNATMAVRRPVVRLVEDGSTLPVTAPDQIAIDGTLTSGAVASVFHRGGVSAGRTCAGRSTAVTATLS